LFLAPWNVREQARQLFRFTFDVHVLPSRL
jgi:hypothetical protein